MKTSYSVGIIGAGRISSGFDSPIDDSYLTHCHAISDIKSLLPIGIYDNDRKATLKASKKWNIKAFYKIDDLLNKSPDIILIAVPDDFHLIYLKKILDFKPKLVVCEKPLTKSYLDSEKIISKYKNQKIKLAVVYQRRYDDDINMIKKLYNSGKTGSLISASVLYSKGMLHNGSHAIDLFIYLFGKPLYFKTYHKVYDYYDDDPTLIGILMYSDKKILFNAGNEKISSLFEIDLIFEKIRYRLIDSGLSIEIYKNDNDPYYSGYKNFKLFEKRLSTLNLSLKNMWNDFVLFLNGKKKIKSKVWDNIILQKTIEKSKK